MNTKENPADYVSRVWVTETKLNHGFLGQNFFGNHKIPGKKVVHVNQIVLQTDVMSVLENQASPWSKVV